MSGQLVVLEFEGKLWSGAGQFLSGQSLSGSVSGRAPLVAVIETADLLNRHDSFRVWATAVVATPGESCR